MIEKHAIAAASSRHAHCDLDRSTKPRKPTPTARHALRKLSDERLASALVRIFSLEGSATYHNMTPQDAVDLVVDNHTHREAVDDNKTPEPEYFGLSPNSYVHH